MSDPTDVRMTPAEYGVIAELLRDRLGLALGVDGRLSLERKLRDRLVRHKLATFSDYMRLLRGDRGEAELAEAIDAITVNETYLLREEPQLRAFADEGVALLGRPRRLSIWSAGCSTGEEAFSIGIVLLEASRGGPSEIRIVGTDVSRRCIQAARKSVYGAGSFRAAGDATRRRWFHERPEGYHPIEELRKNVHFSHLNLLDRGKVALIGTVDAIFCRNVLIYMDEAARDRVVGTFHEMLAPGGLLLLGHSESLLHEQQRSARRSVTNEAGPTISSASLFEPVKLRNEVAYRKPPERRSSPGRGSTS